MYSVILFLNMTACFCVFSPTPASASLGARDLLGADEPGEPGGEDHAGRPGPPQVRALQRLPAGEFVRKRKYSSLFGNFVSFST